jgi:hypothetical protein
MGRKKSILSAGTLMIPVSTTAPSGFSNPNPPMPFPQPQQMGGTDPISQIILSLNTNPYLIGIFMLLLNLGGRFLSLELTKKQEEFLQQPWIRPLIFFTVIFIATRNLVVAFWVTLFFFFLIWVVANEHSPFCMIPSWYPHDLEKEHAKYETNIQKLS